MLLLLLFICYVVSDSLQPHGLQHAMLSCPSLSPRVGSRFMSVELLFHHVILGCPLLLLPSIFPSIRVFSSESATSGGQTIGASVPASVLPMDIQGWFPLGFIGLILLSKGLSSVFSHNTIHNHQFFSALYGSVLISIHATGKTIVWIICTFVSKVMSLFFNMLSTFVIAFLPSVS